MSFPEIRGMAWRVKTFLFKRWIAFQDRFGLYSYADWIKENELCPSGLKEQVRQSLDFPHHPLVSCILTLNNADFEEFKQTLASLSAQTYEKWEAYCIAPPAEIDERLRQIIKNDPRFHLFGCNFEEDFFIKGNQLTTKAFQKTLQENGTIEGEFLFVLSIGDTVSSTLIFRMVEALNQKPDIDLFYTDEDHLTQASRIRHSPFFKPDWSPELLCSVNFLKFAIVRKSQLLAMCAKSEPETLYDDLVLRCAEETDHITHLPEVMIHFLDGKESTNVNEEANRKISFIKQHFEKMGISGVQVDTSAYGTPHLTWQIPQPLVSIIIPTKDHLSYLQRAVESIRELTTYTHYELVIVDNESHDAATHQYYEELIGFPDVRIVKYSGDFNFSAALNLGASQAQGDIFLFLNNDVRIIDPYWLTELARWALLPDVGIVGAKLLYPDGKIQHAGLVLGMEGHANHIFAGLPEGASGLFGSVEWYRNYSALTGACMAIRRNVYDEVGGFNTDYQLAFSDIEICLEVIQRGYRVVYNPFARLIHHEGRTRSRFIPPKDIETGYSRLRDMLSHGDPFYNPNLSYAVRYPTFRRQKEESAEARLNHIISALINR